MSLLDLLRGRHLTPSIEEGGVVRFDYASCAEKDKLTNAPHLRTVEVVDKAGIARDVEEVIDCHTAEAELIQLRLTTAEQARVIQELRRRNAELETTVADMERRESYAVAVATKGGELMAEKLRISADWPIHVKVSGDGKATAVELPGVSLEFRVFEEILVVRMVGSTEVVAYPMPDGQISSEVADAIGGKLRRAGWEGDKSLPATLSLTGVVDGQQDA